MTERADYLDFLAKKSAVAPMRGMAEVPALSSWLYPFQRASVQFLLRAGAGGLFLDTGLGKTVCELEWATNGAAASNGRALILTPLAVAWQIKAEADRFGYQARVIRSQADVREGINICNYDRLEALEPDAFGAVALDESSILKNFMGKTTARLIGAFRDHRWKLAATATPAPNDHTEIGTHAEFLSVMAHNEMLSRFFINDTSTASQEWRLKGHAERPFWDWMASWSRMASLPSDLGDSDAGYFLPPMHVFHHQSEDQAPIMTDGLFGALEVSATSIFEIKRLTAAGRARKAAEIAGADDEPCVIWVDTDGEADAVRKLMPQAVEVRGSMTAEQKEDSLRRFADGTVRKLVTKSSICGWGLNWQHCRNMAFVGRTFSYEAWYQAVRRCWRFGQKQPVNVHLIVAEGEGAIGRVIDRKAAGHARMKAAMAGAMRRNLSQASARKTAYEPTHDGRLPSWLSAA
jgi:hypothetical protein